MKAVMAEDLFAPPPGRAVRKASPYTDRMAVLRLLPATVWTPSSLVDFANFTLLVLSLARKLRVPRLEVVRSTVLVGETSASNFSCR